MCVFAVLTVGNLVLYAMAAGFIALLLYVAIRWVIGSADKAIDERQEVYSRLGGLLDMVQLPKLAGICHSLAAISIVKTFKQVRALVDAVMPNGVPDEVALLRLFEKNYFYQMGKRLDVVEDRAKIVRAVLDHAETRKAIEASLGGDPPKPVDLRVHPQ